MRYALGLGAVLVLVGCGSSGVDVPVDDGDTGAPDTEVPDTSSPDASVPDTAELDTSSPDTSESDTAEPDTSTADATADSGDDAATDSGAADSGSDTAIADIGTDTAVADIGADTAVADIGTETAVDAGSDADVDAGPIVLGCGTNRWRAFVTKEMSTANLGGLVGADARCQVAANTAGLGGAWKAWLSDSAASPSTRFNKSTTGYWRIDRAQIAASYTGLASTLMAPIVIDETGTTSDGEVWTGTNRDGTGTGGCSNWTATTGVVSGVGISSRTNNGWVYVYDQFCNRNNVRLYCFEQCPASGVSDPATGAATTGDKTVFLSSATYSGDLGGLVGADAKCQTLAHAAGRAGTYKAFLGDSTKSASARMSKSTGAYKTTTGTTIAADATAFFSSTHAAPIDRDEAGVLVTGPREVWTGTSGAGTGTGSCGGWTSTSGTVTVGWNNQTDATWSSKFSQFCNRTNVSLYCVQQ